MKKQNKYTVQAIIRGFLLTVFVIMCISALAVCADYAGGVTRHRIDGSEAPVISSDDIASFFEGAVANLYN